MVKPRYPFQSRQLHSDPGFPWCSAMDQVDSLSNRTTLSLKEDLMRSPVAETLAGSMIQYFHGGCKLFGG
ncbi:MAG: hypothetical protein ABI167_12320, partial [Nitrosospira sp.]